MEARVAERIMMSKVHEQILVAAFGDTYSSLSRETFSRDLL